MEQTRVCVYILKSIIVSTNNMCRNGSFYYLLLPRVLNKKKKNTKVIKFQYKKLSVLLYTLCV